MATQTEPGAHEAARRPMPSRVRWALLAAGGAVLVGALYLISARGEALLLDLSALSQRMFCF
jgi:hypothetical protein